METTFSQIKIDNIGIESSHRMIGLFGGTFDPIHEGHIDVAEKIFMEFELSCIYFIVDGNPPHKKNISPAKDRFAMVKTAVSRQDFLVASDIEINRIGITFTIDTVKYFKEKFPNDYLYYIIGADTLYEIETWKDINELCKMTDFICIGRPGIKESDILKKARSLSDNHDARILISEQTGYNISSSAIRQLIAKNEKISGLVPESVEKYINSNGLYKRQR